MDARLDLDAPKHVFLMLFMLTDMKQENSFFKPYYDILPQEMRNMPIFWDEHELRWLEGSYMLTQIADRKEAIVEDYHAICEIAPEFADIATAERFMWARMCVCSRNFGLIVNGVRTSAMVPHADMLNHYRPRETKWTFDNLLQAFTITTLTEITGGAQIYDSYGQKCNHRFLLNYGFAIENNVEADGFCPNEVSILFKLNDADPLYERKHTLFLRDGCSGGRRLRLCVARNENMSWALSLLRIIVANEEEFEALLVNQPFAYRTIKNVSRPISIENERKAMELFLNMLTAIERAFPRTLEEDAEALRHGNLAPFSNERHALIQVKGEKVVLRFFQDFTSTCIRALSGEMEQLCEHLYDQKDAIIADHVYNTLRPLVLGGAAERPGPRVATVENGASHGPMIV